MNTATQDKPAQLPVGERQGVILWAGQHFGVDAGKVLATMKATCFRGDGKTEVTDAEVAALLIVAREHGLNPFLKEIYAFPAKGGGIVPIVGIDGWISIVNKHPQYNGVQFVYDQAEKPAWIQFKNPNLLAVVVFLTPLFVEPLTITLGLQPLDHHEAHRGVPRGSKQSFTDAEYLGRRVVLARLRRHARICGHALAVARNGRHLSLW